MDCPKCEGQLQEIDNYQRVVVDFCGSCKGIWFDAGEVADFFDLTTDIPDLDNARATLRETDLSCPKCNKGLREFQFAKANDLVLDICSGCHGIWLDSGEVPQLEELSRTLVSPKSRILTSFLRLKEQGYEVMGFR